MLPSPQSMHQLTSPTPSFLLSASLKAHQAGALIRKAMRAPLSGVENKSDFDLVTDTDKKSEALVIGTSSPHDAASGCVFRLFPLRDVSALDSCRSPSFDSSVKAT